MSWGGCLRWISGEEEVRVQAGAQYLVQYDNMHMCDECLSVAARACLWNHLDVHLDVHV